MSNAKLLESLLTSSWELIVTPDAEERDSVLEQFCKLEFQRRRPTKSVVAGAVHWRQDSKPIDHEPFKTLLDVELELIRAPFFQATGGDRDPFGCGCESADIPNTSTREMGIA
jgi:hypothetical protein